MVLNEEFLLIEKEWLDERRFVPIITDLLRSTQPIVRYRLDDVLIEEKSPGVFTQLAAIEGRLGDVCYATKDNKLYPLFADLICQKMAAFPFEFDDYRIRQEQVKQFSIQTLPEIDEKEALFAHLNQLFSAQNYELPDWQWKVFEKNESGTKRRRIQRSEAFLQDLTEIRAKMS